MLNKHIIIVLIFLVALITANKLWFEKVNISKSKRKIEKIIHNKEEKANDILSNSKFLTNYTDPSYLNNLLKKDIDNDNFFLFIYERDNLEYWSSNQVIIKSPKIISEGDDYFIKIDNGYYLVFHKYLPDMIHQAVILIPIYYQYSINNQYLKSGFAFKDVVLKKINITTKYINDKSAVKNLQGKYIFSIKENTNYSQINIFVFIVLMICFIYLMFLITKLIVEKIKTKQIAIAVLLILCCVVVIEVLFNQTHLILNFSDLALFSPSLYASKYLASNLGVLFVRVLIFIWVLYFIKYFKPKDTDVVNAMVLLFPVALFFYSNYIIENVVVNSTINFDFFSYTSIDGYSYLSLILFGLLFFGLVQIMNYLFKIKRYKKNLYIISFFVIVLSAYKYYQGSNLYYVFYLGLWFVSFTLIFYIKNEIKAKYHFVTSILIIALISMLLTTTLWIQSTNKELEIKKKSIQELFTERDIVEEFELSTKETTIVNDQFISQYLANPYLINIDLNERILKSLGSFNKNYIINIYAYDFNKNPIKGTVNKSADYFDKILRLKKTSKISQNFYHIPIKETGEKYIGKFIYERDSAINGFLYVELIPRVFKINGAYPELLAKNKTYYDEILKNYSYAIYQNKKLIKSSGDYQYATQFNFGINPSYEYEQIEQVNYNHLIYQNKDKIVVVSEPQKSIWIAISIFSFIVLNLLILFILLDYLGFSYELWIDTKIKDFFVNNTLQKQIQNYTIVLMLFSLSILALITFIYFNSQYKTIYKNKIEQNTSVVVKSFKQSFNEDYPIYGEETYQWVMQNKLQQRSDIFETDITAYNTNGDMIATSNPEIYKNNLVSKKMDADAYFALHTEKKSKFINEEKIGKLHYLSLYLAITTDGDTKLYLQFPHYNIDKYLRSEIILFLISLINIYVFLLILIAFAAVFLSRSATNSLNVISEHIKNVNLNEKNIPLEWNKEDEIGALVKQYNNMLVELERSAALLAKSEREGAWSEMAKQVAHEIKNPLTPMKLSIQHLQRALSSNDPDIKDLTKKITERLIEQIDILTDIASAFSDFAKLPSTRISEIDFFPILSSVIDLFQETENININFSSNLTSTQILGDKNQLARVFTNIIKNAVQSIPENREGKIDINLVDTATTYIVSIKDNGEGIAEDKREKIFEPNFTTKSSGTGLGLAICRNIINNIRGKIWLDSKENEFTIFYIELPKV